MTDAGAGRPAVAATFGVEEEYHVVDALTLALRDSPDLGAAASHGELGPRLQAEIASTQLETATGVCATLAELRTELLAARCEAAYAAESVGAALVVASTHPTASWRDQRLTSKVRYIELFEQWGLLALQQVICGCHVHVSVPDLDTAVAVMDHARPYLPTILALTGSSPFHEGADTGYESYRTMWWSRWPTAGAPEPLGDAAAYTSLVEDLQHAVGQSGPAQQVRERQHRRGRARGGLDAHCVPGGERLQHLRAGQEQRVVGRRQDQHGPTRLSPYLLPHAEQP